jgi:hypothetical protein
MPTAEIKHYHQGACRCCGTDTACTRGVVVKDRGQVARYLIKWTVGFLSHGMSWLISLPNPASGGEVSVSLGYSFEHNAFMVRQPGDYCWEAGDLVGFGELLDRDRVIGTPLAEQVFAIVDDIWLSDP